MWSAVQALALSPAPNIFVIFGLFLIFLCLVGQITQYIVIKKERALLTSIIGFASIVLGIFLLLLGNSTDDIPDDIIIVSNCKAVDDAGNCTRCEFEIEEKSIQNIDIMRTCRDMRSGTEVAVRFVGSYWVNNRGSGSDCWLENDLIDINGSRARSTFLNVASCEINLTRETELVSPQHASRNFTGGFKVAHCQWGGMQNSQCDVQGRLLIFSERGTE